MYDASSETAFWIHVQAYFRELPDFNLFRIGQTLTVHLPVDQKLEPDAMRLFAQYRDEALRPFQQR